MQHAQTTGLQADSLLEGTSLVLQDLLQSDRGVTLEETRRVLANGAAHLGHGWHLSLAPRLTIPSHGPLGFAAVTAPSLGAATDVLLRYIAIRAPFLWLAGSQEDSTFVIRLHETLDMGVQRPALVELALLSIQALLEWPLGRDMTGAEITFVSRPDGNCLSCAPGIQRPPPLFAFSRGLAAGAVRLARCSHAPIPAGALRGRNAVRAGYAAG